jgi:hypothetical protein
MKMADVLHSIADMLDQVEDSGDTSGDNIGKEASDYQLKVSDGAEDAGSGTELDTNPVMIPPLQQKLEILKKSAGMENAMEGEADELGDIKKLTGIKAVIQHETSEDNDIVG